MKVILTLFAGMSGLLSVQAQDSSCLSNNYPSSGFVPTNYPGADAAARGAVLPLIDYLHVPITLAIENLARQAGLNYQLDPSIEKSWFSGSYPSGEPQVSVRLEKVTAQACLNRLLNAYGLILVENSMTSIAVVTFADDPLPMVNFEPLELETLHNISETNLVIPLIEMHDVPLAMALDHLISQSGIHAEIDSQLRSQEQPMLSIQWENLTARQALSAVCEHYRLIVTKDGATGIVYIKPGASEKHH